MKSFRQRAAEGLQTGDSFTLSRCFSQEDIQRFAQISATTIRCISMHRPVESTVETSPSHHTTIDQLHPRIVISRPAGIHGAYIQTRDGTPCVDIERI
ncbi:hypothetical protein TMM008_15200 [Pseudomonas sp. 008]|nr:hypothetical protein TMM008_15200 [Pseudomonas sp. 008]